MAMIESSTDYWLQAVPLANSRKIGTVRIEPRAAGWEARTLLLCYDSHQCVTFSIYFYYLFPNSALIYLQQMALPVFLRTTLCRSVIRTHVSRVAPDWDL